MSSAGRSLIMNMKIMKSTKKAIVDDDSLFTIIYDQKIILGCYFLIINGKEYTLPSFHAVRRYIPSASFDKSSNS